LGHILLALNLKQEKIPLIKQGIFSNKFAVGWLIGMIFLVIAMTQWHWMQTVLGTTNLSAENWVLVIAGAILSSGWMEVLKWIRITNK